MGKFATDQLMFSGKVMKQMLVNFIQRENPIFFSKLVFWLVESQSVYFCVFVSQSTLPQVDTQILNVNIIIFKKGGKPSGGGGDKQSG